MHVYFVSFWILALFNGSNFELKLLKSVAQITIQWLSHIQVGHSFWTYYELKTFSYLTKPRYYSHRDIIPVDLINFTVVISLKKLLLMLTGASTYEWKCRPQYACFVLCFRNYKDFWKFGDLICCHRTPCNLHGKSTTTYCAPNVHPS